MRQWTTSSTWVKGLVDAFSRLQIEVAPLLKESGIDTEVLQDDEGRIPTDLVSHLWDLAIVGTRDRALGVRAAAAAKPTQYGIVGYAMMSSPDLRTGIERLIRYMRVVSETAHIRFDAVPEGGRVSLDISAGRRPVPVQRVEYGLLMGVSMCRWVMNGSLTPVSVTFRSPQPEDVEPYTELLRCPIKFDAALDSFTLSANELDAPLPTAMPELAAMHERMAKVRLDKLQAPGTAQRVQQALQARLQDGTPRRAQIARDLHISDRTLQRRLAEESTSFEALVELTRKDLAEQYLKETETPLAQVAFLLGYADQRSFFRACSRWFGRTPGELRASANRRR